MLGIKNDLVCANQYAASVAADYGGDLDQPWTLVGHSLGASLVLYPKDEVLRDTGGALDPCVEGWPDAGAIVAMVGCHYEDEGEDTELLRSTLGLA